MLVTPKFQPTYDAQVFDLLTQIRIGTLVTKDTDQFDGTPLPWVPCFDSEGHLELIGHFARHNPQVARVRAQPQVFVVFLGPNAYVSPRGLPTPKSAPTWNFVAIHIEGYATLLDNPQDTERAVEHLVDAMERDRPEPWSSREMAERRDQLLRYVIGVRITATRIDAKLKLGQNESLSDLQSILQQCESVGESKLVRLMREANASRLESTVF